MYKLLIVDDEKLVRSSISQIIDWHSLGFSEVYEAEDGEQALDIALKIKPHLILTDIKMPFMDGLALTKHIKKHLPASYMVILSGYDEFELAQEAICLGVKDYILKPIGAKTLYGKIKAICQEMNGELKQRDYLTKMKNQLHQSLPLLRERLLHQLICTPGNNERILEGLQALEISFDVSPYSVCVVEPDLSAIQAKDDELYCFAVKNIISDTIGKQYDVFSDHASRIILVFNNHPYLTSLENRNILSTTLQVIQNNVNDHLHIPLTSAMGTTVKEMHLLHNSYTKALLALECKYTLGKNNIYDIHDLDYIQSEFYYPFDTSSYLLEAIKAGEIKNIKHTLLSIASLLKKQETLTFVNIKLIFIEIITNILKVMAKTNGLSTTIWAEGIALYDTLEKLNTIDDMVKPVEAFCMHVAEKLTLSRNNSNHNIIAKAKHYIDHHYHLEDLSLNTVADAACVSPVYLSSLFKKETGINFKNYLINKRMEKAMELLKTTQLKTYEIAHLVGFPNPHYFSVSFRKYTGESPTDYRKNVEAS
ncbi:response regulator [Vallitalea pronyensis]|uniref:Stage 0 sporulation protein A homolog n=1 Tax=Vallitalea pronyensis TaxID=1348613 RepID=A0A8J8SGK0_9FIRM|nr:response regulator [Vallitalea pronyensis]QUI22437.1 response regulator [Vallitalea pronyensis]